MFAIHHNLLVYLVYLGRHSLFLMARLLIETREKGCSAFSLVIEFSFLLYGRSNKLEEMEGTVFSMRNPFSKIKQGGSHHEEALNCLPQKGSRNLSACRIICCHGHFRVCPLFFAGGNKQLSKASRCPLFLSPTHRLMFTGSTNEPDNGQNELMCNAGASTSVSSSRLQVAYVQFPRRVARQQWTFLPNP